VEFFKTANGRLRLDDRQTLMLRLTVNPQKIQRTKIRLEGTITISISPSDFISFDMIEGDVID